MDKSLKDLDSFNGTIDYTNSGLYRTKLTDGVVYIMSNGYSWFVTDVLAVIETKEILKNEPFLSIKLKLENDKGKMIITNGNNKVFYTQDYDYTDAQKELQLYWTNEVLMLSREY